MIKLKPYTLCGRGVNWPNYAISCQMYNFFTTVKLMIFDIVGQFHQVISSFIMVCGRHRRTPLIIVTVLFCCNYRSHNIIISPPWHYLRNKCVRMRQNMAFSTENTKNFLGRGLRSTPSIPSILKSWVRHCFQWLCDVLRSRTDIIVIPSLFYQSMHLK